MFCCSHTMQILQSIQTIKKGCIKNIKYIMLKHYKQEHLHYCQPLSLPKCHTYCNDTNYIVSHKPVHNIVNPTDSICPISSSSQSRQTNLVTLSSSTVDTQAINSIFYCFNYFDSQPNQLYFFLNMFHPHQGGARGIVWRALNSINKCTYNVSTLEDTFFSSKATTLYHVTPQNIISTW